MSVISEQTPILGKRDLSQNFYAIQSQAHIEGALDEMKSSPVRRTFCLIVLFDLISCLIIWILYTHNRKTGPWSPIPYENEVLNYSFSGSLFDVVCLSGTRFIYLEVTYGCIKSAQPWFLAVSTAATSGFTLVKTISFKGNRSSTLGYFLILSSLVIAWTETLFLIYRVLPKEKAAQKVLEYYDYMANQYGNISSRSEDPSEVTTDNGGRTRLNSLSDDEFYSPRQTRSSSPTQLANKHILELSKTLLEDGAKISNNSKDWKYLAGDVNIGFVTCKQVPFYSGKIFKIECFLDILPELLYKDMIDNVEGTPLWNPQIRSAKRLASISDNVDITYNISNEALKGYIAPRDMVVLRAYGNTTNKFFIYMTSYDHEDYPTQPNLIRSTYGIGAIVLERNKFDTYQTKCIWIVNYNPNGNLFRAIVDRAMPNALIEMVSNLKKHCNSLNCDI